MGQLYRMDPIADGNPIGWTIRTLEKKLPKMLQRADYSEVAAATDLAEVARVLPDVEACARELVAAKRNTVKHNRGMYVFEAGNIKFGLEMRRLPVGDGGLSVHVLADLGGSTENSYVEETELLAFDCFWDGRITTMARETRTIASIGTRPWSRTHSVGSLTSSRATNWAP
jgi:hypothetical protein